MAKQNEAMVAADASVSKALTLGSDAFRGSLEPTSAQEAFQVAELMASIGYCGVSSAAEALGRIMTGRGLGLSAMQALRGIYTVNGRPGIDAALMHALCLQSPLCEYFDIVPEECDDTQATYVAKRIGRPEVKHTFTIEQAEKMGVLGRGEDSKAKAGNNWDKVRAAMLRARAKSELARIVFPDLIFGMYSREEILAGADNSPASPKDPNELAGDLLSAEEAAVEAAKGRVTVVQAAKRDYAAEAEALKERIRAAGGSRAARNEVRDAIAKWKNELPDNSPWVAQVVALYNETKPGRTAAPTPPTEPAPVPEGNMFAPDQE